MKRATHSLLLAAVASAILLPVLASQHEPIRERAVTQLTVLQPSTSASDSSTTAAPTSTPAPTTTVAASSSSNPTSSAAAPGTSAASSSVANGASTTTTHATSDTAAPTTQAAVTSVVPTIATDAAGKSITTYVTESVVPSSATPSQTDTSSNSGGSGLNTGSIVGLSVAGGIAALGIVLFFVWKCTRKRFTDFDDSEAIKWPELNVHNNDVHALPTNSTGRAGFGPENDSDVNLTRPPSPSGAYANSIAASSVPEMYGSGDPYAVPPLPHLNPNQPYRDEPSVYGQPAGYYDPYRGPVPNTFTDTVTDGHDAESIPMTQMARVRSPGPQLAYDMQGRGSPAPQAAMGYAGMEDRSRTPNPGALGTGRASPSPHPGYGYGPR